uniref:Uncharacterized protein n=2 Tax=Canis lupus familiaris TaxID=9615 RepID=A0A8I3MM44_CANLF
MGQPGWLRGLAPPSAQGVILKTRDRVPHWAPCMESASPSVFIEPNNSVVLISTNDTGVSIQCSFNGQSLKLIERMKLSQDKGTLAICPVRREDAGNYKCEVSKVVTSSKTDPLTELHKPSITSNNSSPVENADSVVLMCEAQTQSTSCLWSVNSKSLPDSPRLELSLDNRTLTVHGVTRNDTGPYECETRNPVSADHSDPFTLNVLYSSYHQGANLSLSCRTASNPPAQYSWLINGRPQPSTQELFIPNITTTVKAITVSGKCIPGASAVSTVVRVCLPFREEPRSSFPFATKAQICP